MQIVDPAGFVALRDTECFGRRVVGNEQIATADLVDRGGG